MPPKGHLLHPSAQARQDASLPEQGRRRRSFSRGYGEDYFEPRTKLETVLSIPIKAFGYGPR